MGLVSKRENTYRITIEETNIENPQEAKSMQFELTDRENVFNLVDTLKKHSGLEEQEATKVGVALRLLGPVMMKNRKHALFIDFMPHFKTFMQSLKTTIKNAVKEAK